MRSTRPPGVLVSSIVLFLLAALELLGLASLLLGIAVALGGHGNYDVISTSTPQPSAEAMHRWMQAALWIMAAMGALVLAWTLTTAIGLLRLRNWARISALILAGCIAVYALFSLSGTVLSLFLPHNLPSQAPPQTLLFLHIFLALSGLFHLLLISLAIWALIYFNRASIRAVFLPAYAYSAPAMEATTHWPNPTEPPLAAPTGKRLFPVAPIAITILGWLLLASSLVALLCCLIPLPAFFLGHIFAGPAKIALYLAFSVLTACIGWNLLQLREPARRAAIALNCLGAINGLLVFLPAYAHRMTEYTNQLLQTMTIGLPGQNAESYFVVAQFHPISLFLGALFGLAFNLAIVWLLHHDRRAFHQFPAPAPAP